MKQIKLAVVLLLAGTMVACTNGNENKQKSEAAAPAAQNTETMTQKAPFKKKYTNADFYTDGKFNQDVAMKAYKEMFDYYGVPMTKFMEENMWVTDFGLGDFENVGMGGIFWVNDPDHRYFAHEIYLLPNQMIPEHKHVATEYPAKFESWMMHNGWAYNFSEVGEATPNAPAIPESQKATTISKNFVIQKPGEIIHLKEEGTFHFLYAGDEGAIVSEYANYHDNNGLRFTNPKSKM